MTPLQLDSLFDMLKKLETDAAALGAAKSMTDRAREARVLVSWVMEKRWPNHD